MSEMHDDVKRELEAASAPALETELPASLTDQLLLMVRLKRRQDDQQLGILRDYPDGTAGHRFQGPSSQTEHEIRLEIERMLTEASRTGRQSWRLYLELEMRKLFMESKEERLEQQLITIAALAIAWAEGIRMRVDRRRIDAQTRGLRVIRNGGLVLHEVDAKPPRLRWWQKAFAWFSEWVVRK